MPKIDLDLIEEVDTYDLFPSVRRQKRGKLERKKRFSPRPRATQQEEFKCGHCKTFVGPPVSGGKHRNHCPLCLFSKHVDRSRPGDRLSECSCLMEPVGTFNRRNGEQMIMHHCRGCGAQRVCRVAADDHPVACMRLAPIAAPASAETRRSSMHEDEISA